MRLLPLKTFLLLLHLVITSTRVSHAGALRLPGTVEFWYSLAGRFISYSYCSDKMTFYMYEIMLLYFFICYDFMIFRTYQMWGRTSCLTKCTTVQLTIVSPILSWRIRMLIYNNCTIKQNHYT